MHDALTPLPKRWGGKWRLLSRLALQNLFQRPTRTAMLAAAVAVNCAAVFASFIVARGIEASTDRSFARMGADLIVVPAETLVNITSALLTVQPTDSTLDAKVADEIRQIDGVASVATQRIYRVPVMVGMPNHTANLIAFDPATDFTVIPWIDEQLSRPMKEGDLIVGGRRDEKLGDELELCGSTQIIYARLGRSGVGPFDESFFASDATLAAMAKTHSTGAPGIPSYDPNRVSAILVRLAFGSTSEQVRFVIAQIPGIKVIPGGTIITSTRQTMKALLIGVSSLAILMVIGSLILVSLLFSAIVSERRREVGLLRAIGARRSQVIRILLAEAALTTGLGGIGGVLLGGILLLVFQRSLGYLLETMRIGFLWPPATTIAIAAVVCAIAAALVGVLGAFLPAWKASAKDPYNLIQQEGG
jgi:putative ABC transport system permease protein